MEWNTQNLFYILYAGLCGVLLWLYFQRPKSVKFFKKQILDSHIQEQKKKKMRKIQTPLGGEPHEILGVSLNCSKEDIMKAYKQKMKLYHPDVVAHKGEEYQKWAKELSIKIQNAKEALLKKRKS